MVSLYFPCSVTGFAVPVSVLRDMSVLRSELVAMNAMRLASIDCADADTPQHIFAMRDGFEMRRIYAGLVPAEMIKFKVRGNRSGQHFIKHSMGKSFVLTML